MSPSTAEERLRAGLRHCSEMSKALSDLQAQVEDASSLRPVIHAVGAILGWFDFQLLRPIEREHPELVGWSTADRDWSPESASVSTLADAFEACDRAVANSLDVAQFIAGDASLSLGARAELDRLVLEYQSVGRAARRNGAA